LRECLRSESGGIVDDGPGLPTASTDDPWPGAATDSDSKHEV